MSYVSGLTIGKRRHPTQHLTPEQAIARLNTITDEANAQIARMQAHANHWKSIAAELEAENRQLQARIADLEKRLRQATPKAGPKSKEKQRMARQEREGWQ